MFKDSEFPTGAKDFQCDQIPLPPMLRDEKKTKKTHLPPDQGTREQRENRGLETNMKVELFIQCKEGLSTENREDQMPK